MAETGGARQSAAHSIGERKMRTSPTRLALAGAVIALGIAACAAVPVYNVTDAPVTTASGKALKASQVRQAIVTAGGKLGWRITDSGPGHLEGVLNLRDHSATVDIPYSATSYGIQFKSGVNLKAADGNIHKNYNGWVQNLDRDIRAELLRL
jgi:hypothetical protein